MGGHDHFYERALTRRSFLIGTGAVATTLLGTRALIAPAALAADDRAKPIPGGIVVGGVGYHVNSPSYSAADPTTIDDQSTVTDFDGIVGCAHARGTGTGHQPPLGDVPLGFDVDMRFMRGTYIAVDGVSRQATFGFI